MRWLICIGCLAAIAGAALAQPPLPSVPPDHSWRGLKPFAGATIDWFARDRQSDRLIFYSYWTGYAWNDPKLHWVVRHDGSRRGTAATGWAWSDTCPALGEEMSRFEIPRNGEFAASAWPPMKPQIPDPDNADFVTIIAADGHAIDFWAAPDASHTTTSVRVSGPWEGDYDSDSVGRVLRLFESGTCGSASAPDIPTPTG